MSLHEKVRLDHSAVPGGLVGGPFGSSLGTLDYVETGVPVIRGTNLGGGDLVSGAFVFVSDEKADSELSRNQAKPGDLIFTQRGTLGQVAIVPEEPHQRYVISQSQMRLRVDAAKFAPRFVYYACKEQSFLKQLQDNSIATGVPHINLGILSRLTIPNLEVAQQRAIAEVLGALDDKIATNTKLAQTADHLSRSIFNFGLADRAELVPLSAAARFVNGKAFTKNATGTGRVVIRIAELNSGIGGSTVYNNIDVSDEHLAHPGDILFAWSGSLTLSRWYRPEGIINQHIFKVLPHTQYPGWLVYQLIKRKLVEFQGIAADKATTMGHIQRRHLDEPVNVPAAEWVSSHDAEMSGLWRLALVAEQENLQLEQIRDTLLPQLMSGKLRVRDAEQLVEEVV